MEVLKPLLALLAIVNPVGAIPFFIHFTGGFSREQRRRTIHVAAVGAFTVIAVSALVGLRIIEFFGISLASFQVGGGMLLLVSALQMLNAQQAESRSDDLREGSDKVDAGDSIAVVPLTIPLLTGPATISTMVIYAEKTRHWWQLAILVGYGVVIGLSVWLAFSLSGRIARVLGKTGINVMTRLMGILLAALAVEVMSDGLVKLFPGARAVKGAVDVEPAAPYDWIVCGAGTAGCLLANRLSADRSKRVLLIEAGGNDDYVWVHIPVGYLYCIGNPRTDWLYATEPAAGLNGRSLRYPRGKVLGGCSSINGMIYMRGQARDYDGWGAGDGFGANPGWSWDECLPYFLRHEDFHKGADAFHAAPGFDPKGTRPGGEWRVEKQRLRWDVLDAFAEAAQQAGIPHSSDFNRGDNEGVGYFDVNQRAGVRWNATKAFLRPIERRPNLQVWTGAHIDKVELDADGRASGVRVTPIGGAEAETAMLAPGGEVVLATGAIGTPQILQLSGIGPAPLLAAHGIAVRRDLPGVGGNLQDHLQIRAVFGVEGVLTLNRLANSFWGKAKIGLHYAWKRSGPMSMAPSQLGAFTRSRPDLPHPNLEYHVQPLSLDAFGEPLHRHDAFTASVCNLNPTSRGTVQIRSAASADAPRIAPDYLATEADRLVAAESLRLTRRIVAQPALARYKPRELKPGVQFQSDAELAQLAGDIGTTIFHPVGTAKMGPAADPAAVVDARLRVHGVPGLRIVDASVMPTITSGNTNSPTLMIAERAAEWIRAGA